MIIGVIIRVVDIWVELLTINCLFFFCSNNAKRISPYLKFEYNNSNFDKNMKIINMKFTPFVILHLIDHAIKSK